MTDALTRLGRNPWLDPLDDEKADATRYSPVTLEIVKLSDDGRLSVVGESHYQEALYIVAAGQEVPREFDQHLPVDALLIPEPENLHDKKAVRIDVKLTPDTSLKVGYLARDVAAVYQPHLIRLQKAGKVGMCPGRINGGGPDRFYGIYLHVAPARLILTPILRGIETSYAKIQSRRIYLKAEWTCTVSRDEDHSDVIRPFAPRLSDEWATVSVQLGFCVVTKGRHAGKRAIEVRLGGRRAGELTQAMTARYEDMVDDVESRGARAYCDGFVQIDPRRGPRLELLMPRDPSRPSSWVEWHQGT